MTTIKTPPEVHDPERPDSGIDTARNAVAHSIDKTRAKASEVARTTSQAIDANPLGILVAGLALGAIVGAVIPRSNREKTLLKPLGAKIGATAAMAVAAAREAGKNELQTLGLDTASIRDQAKTMLGGLGKAVSTAGAAAAKSATGKIEG